MLGPPSPTSRRPVQRLSTQPHQLDNDVKEARQKHAGHASEYISVIPIRQEQPERNLRDRQESRTQEPRARLPDGAGGQLARRLRMRTRITPMTMQMMAGQNVKKKSKPGPIGLGFGSGHNPSAAAPMMKTSGPAPTRSKPRPTSTQSD